MIDLGREIGGSNEFLSVSVFAIIMLTALRLARIEHCLWDGCHLFSLFIVIVDKTHGCINKEMTDLMITNFTLCCDFT